MHVMYCPKCNRFFCFSKITHYCPKCRDVLVEAEIEYKEFMDQSANERYSLAYRLTKKLEHKAGI